MKNISMTLASPCFEFETQIEQINVGKTTDMVKPHTTNKSVIILEIEKS
jgi:hypothetical protein